MASIPTRTLAAAAAAGLCGVALFQIALALGAPLGAAAWGGAEVVLSAQRRASSAVAAGVLVLFALVVLGRAGFLARTRGWMRIFRVAIWLLVAQLALNTLANVASSSPWERYGMSVVTLVLCALCVAVGRAPVPPPSHAQPGG